MKQPLRKLVTQFDKSVLEKALSLYGMDAPCKDMKGYENHVYQCSRNQKPYILRIGHVDHRSFKEVNAEIEFIEHLISKGCPTVKPIKSARGERVEKISVNENDYFTVVGFTLAPGETISLRKTTKENIYAHGRATAMLHQSSRGFKPSELRQTWKKDTLNLIKRVEERGLLSDEDIVVKKYLKKLMSEIQTKGKTRRDYGLIHSDIHEYNFKCDNAKVTIYDFDDSVYAHYAYDLAVILVETFPYQLKVFNEAYDFLDTWIEGYSSVEPFIFEWLEYLDLLMTARIVSSLFFMKQNEDGAPEDWELEHYRFCYNLAVKEIKIGFNIREDYWYKKNKNLF